MKIWKKYKLTQQQGYAIGFIHCRCGIIHDHKLIVDRFLWWIRFYNGSRKFKYRLIPKVEDIGYGTMDTNFCLQR